MMKNKITYLFLFVILCGCASISKSEYACSTVAESNTLINGKIGTYFFGNIFQLGDCAVSEKLRIETGDYLQYKITPIKKQIYESSSLSKKDLISLFELFGCDPKYEKEIVSFSKNNYKILFEDSQVSSGRERMIYIRGNLLKDETMNKICFQ